MKNRVLFAILLLSVFLNGQLAFAETVKTSHLDLFDTFTFPELVELSKIYEPQGPLKDKLDNVLNNVIVDNTIASNDFQYKNDEKIGEYVRVATWNIARGFNYEKIKYIFTDISKLEPMVKSKNEKNEILSQAETLKNADIIVMNEVDAGMPRTGYKNIVKEIATAGKYNYAYGVEFVEVDPVHLGLENIKWSEETFLKQKGLMPKNFVVDKNKYKGLHGTAILSKFPLSNVRIYRLPKYYDWFKDETTRMSEIERIRRNVADKAFKEQVIREIRQGSRMAIIADVTLPSNGEKLTIVATHFENRVLPVYRQKMLRELLSEVSDVNNPLILLGDFNTTTQDGRPTTFAREVKKRLKDPNYIIRTALLYSNPISAIINVSTISVDAVRKQANPTVRSIPVFAPNFEKKFFNIIKTYEFDDDTKFDRRGDKSSSVGKAGRFSNSNQRKQKGFVPTYLFERNFYIARYKLDWIFVKTCSENRKNDSYKFAPHFGRTLFELNYGLDKPLADHTPITVDLPVTDYKNAENK